MAFTQYTIQSHPLSLQYGLALSAKLSFSVCLCDVVLSGDDDKKVAEDGNSVL